MRRRIPVFVVAVRLSTGCARSMATTSYAKPFDVVPATACSEPRLLELGYAFEQTSKRRVPPPSTP